MSPRQPCGWRGEKRLENPLGSTSEVYASNQIETTPEGVFRPFMSLAGTSGIPSSPNPPESVSFFDVHRPQVQVIWHFLHTPLALGAVRLTSEVFPLSVCHRSVNCRHASLCPSPRLQRLDLDRAVLPRCLPIAPSEDFLMFRLLRPNFLSCGFPKNAPPPT